MKLSKIVRSFAVAAVCMSLVIGCARFRSSDRGDRNNDIPTSPSDPSNPGGNLSGFVNPAIVELLSSGNYVILTKTGISSVPGSVLTGDIGVSPEAMSAVTGFSVTNDASNTFATSPQVTGKIYAADLTPPTPGKLTTDVSAMEAAYIDGFNRANPDKLELLNGDISGISFGRGLYKWTNTVLVNGDVYINGSSTDVFIFQIAGGLTMAANKKFILQGGALAKNIFFIVGEAVEIGTGAHFEGIILGQTNAALLTLSTMNGRLLMQTAVTLDQATVTQPL